MWGKVENVGLLNIIALLYNILSLSLKYALYLTLNVEFLLTLFYSQFLT